MLCAPSSFAKGAKKGDISKLANDAVRREILRQTVLELQDKNSDFSDKQASALANESVNWSRARRS